MAENRTIEVGVGEWKRGSRGTILYAQGVSVGICAGLSNPVTGVGYLGFFTLDFLSQFEGMIRTAAQGPGVQQLQPWYGGGALIAPGREGAAEVNAQTTRLRMLCADVYTNLGFGPRHGHWLPIGKYLNLSLVCGTARYKAVVLDDPAR